MIPIYRWPEKQALQRIKNYTPQDEEAIWSKARTILQDVRQKGDQALFAYTRNLDGFEATAANVRVGREEINSALKEAGDELLTHLRRAREKILDFHRRQKQEDWFCQDDSGSLVGQMIRPLDRVGLYVPGGTARYPSSVLMTCLPAVVAGVKEIVMVTPPGPQGGIAAATLAAASLSGVQEIYRVGGAQAIAALAYGTESIRPVDKIVGPGNIYVTMAKKMVFGQVGIDMPAGPSEVLIIGDGGSNPDFAAADLLSQAEHDPRARAILVTPDEEWAQKVARSLEGQLSSLARQSTADRSIKERGAVLLVRDLEEAFLVANQIAPEHLELLVAEPWTHLSRIRHAGAVFLGDYSPEPVGDYWAGPNHVLPTGGAARFASPLSVADFCKRSSLISYTRQGLLQAADSIKYLSSAEGLAGHGRSVAIRFEEEK